MNELKCFGVIDKYMLFGGGLLLASTVEQLKEQSVSIFVVTSQRHSKEVIFINSKEIAFVDFLKDEGVEYVISQDIAIDNKVLDFISDNTLGLSFGAAWIFKKNFIDRFHGNLLNLHGSKLPQDRGGGGFSWRILRGDTSGISLIHKIDTGVDTGDIVFSEEYTFPDNCRVPIDYQEYSIKKYKDLLDVFFKRVKNLKEFSVSIQQECFSSYWPRLFTDMHGYIDWSWKLVDIERFICAFDEPYVGASTFINDKKVRIKECCSWTDDGIFHPFQKGIIYRKNESSIFVAKEHGSLIINRVIDQQGNDIKKLLQVGDRFYTPKNILEEALQFRAIYTPTGLKRVEK